MACPTSSGESQIRTQSFTCELNIEGQEGQGQGVKESIHKNSLNFGDGSLLFYSTLEGHHSTQMCLAILGACFQKPEPKLTR